MAQLLVVEDDQTIGDALRTSLRAHGHDVHWERSGRGALSCADVFDLVLLDLGLPDLDGVEVCRRLRSDLPAAVLIILTARSDSKLAEAADGTHTRLPTIVTLRGHGYRLETPTTVPADGRG